MYNSRLYDERRAAGLCWRCGRPSAGATYCRECQDRLDTLRKELRGRRKAAGMCPRCGRRPPEPGYATCAQCRAKQRAYWRTGGACDGECDACRLPECRFRETLRMRYEGQNRARRQAREEAGLCVNCGAAPARPGLLTCEGCAERKRAAQAAKRAMWKEAGLCGNCGRPREPGRLQCHACLEKQRAYGRKKDG